MLASSRNRVAALALIGLAACAACAACDREAPPSKPFVGAACPRAVTNTLQIGLAADRRDLADLSVAQRDRFGEVMVATVERCEDDAWSRDVIECLAGAASSTDVRRCKRDLTPEQARASEATLDSVLAGTWSPRATAPAADSAAPAPM